MYEGKLPRREVALPLAARGESDALRPVDWHDLVAKLAAARDARASLLAGVLHGEASFDAGSAQRIAAHRDAEDPVNLEDSANLKGAGRTPAEAASAGPHGALRDQ
ncbi:MAG: hypothetical protein B7Z33_02285 [Sphingomonadales bacterium 12-68-11]|nr:MAG: hypothetical protein B7Z33_02285 [Sphingomonadales bacterium 12-68-11]